MWFYVCVCVCVCVCVSQRIPISFPEIFVLLIKLSLKIILLKQKQHQSVANTSLFQYFEIGKVHSSPLLKFWCLGNHRRNMWVLYVKELPNHILTYVRFFFFACWGYSPSLKFIWSELRQWFTMCTKNYLRWGFLLVAKAKILYGMHRSH